MVPDTQELLSERHELRIVNRPCAVWGVGGIGKGAHQEVTGVVQVTQEGAVVVIRGETCFESGSRKTCRLTGWGWYRERIKDDSQDSDLDT